MRLGNASRLASGGSRNEFHEILARAENEQERLAAILRIVVFAALLATVLSLRQHGTHHHPVLGVTMFYGGIALVGLFLAWLRIFHPIVPYIFVTLEVALVVLHTTLMAPLMGQPPTMIAALPVATIIFILLVHAAMRYRPWLVVYAGGLYLAGLSIAIIFLPDQADAAGSLHTGDHGLVHHRILPVVVVGVTVLILFVTGRGTRKILQASVEEKLGRTRLSRFFAPDIADQVVSGGNDHSTEGQILPVVILFADIRGFSTIAENMEPSELSVLLAEFREILSGAIQANGGVVDKFIGDAVMAVFGFPDTGNSPPDRALKCANAILEGVCDWSHERENAGFPAVETGIGLHYGDAFVGVIGKENLLEFTVIGDTVNVAERIERLTRTLNADVAVSGALAEKTIGVGGSEWLLATDNKLIGRSQPIDIYYLPRKARRIMEDKVSVSSPAPHPTAP